jgi:hypothetical protein
MFDEHLPVEEYMNLDRHQLRGWLSSVAVSLSRRAALPPKGNSLQLAAAAASAVEGLDWRYADDVVQGLNILKCFTQPTWWVNPSPDGIHIESNVRDHDVYDRHFTGLLSERQYRRDKKLGRGQTWVLAVTDVVSLFLGGVTSQEDFKGLWDGSRQAGQGIAEGILVAMRQDLGSHHLADGLLASRLRSARHLNVTLDRIADVTNACGGSAYATHGDGVTVLLPRDAWDDWAQTLKSGPPDLPTVAGGVAIGDSIEDAEDAAEAAALTARAKYDETRAHFVAHFGPAPTELLRSAQRTWRSQVDSPDAVERWRGTKALARITAKM